MNPRKILARLGPKSPALVRFMLFGTTCTTKPTTDILTDLDIAAALGGIQNPLARAIYEHMWTPGVAENKVRYAKLVQDAAAAVVREQERRREHGNPWPDLPKELCRPIPGLRAPALCAATRMAHTAITEIAGRNNCSTCAGYGEQFDRTSLKVVDCPSCFGTGVTKVGKKRRARALGLSNFGYAKAHDAYDWLVGYLRGLEAEAASEHWRAMQ